MLHDDLRGHFPCHRFANQLTETDRLGRRHFRSRARSGVRDRLCRELPVRPRELRKTEQSAFRHHIAEPRHDPPEDQPIHQFGVPRCVVDARGAAETRRHQCEALDAGRLHHRLQIPGPDLFSEVEGRGVALEVAN